MLRSLVGSEMCIRDRTCSVVVALGDTIFAAGVSPRVVTTVGGTTTGIEKYGSSTIGIGTYVLFS